MRISYISWACFYEAKAKEEKNYAQVGIRKGPKEGQEIVLIWFSMSRFW
jgi:hypothetical protein